MATETNAGNTSSLTSVALRSHCIVSEDSAEAERDRLLKELNRCKMEN